MSSKSARKPSRPAVAKTVSGTRQDRAQAAQAAAPAVDMSERMRVRQARLSPTEVACLGLRNGMTPEEVNARIEQVYPEG